MYNITKRILLAGGGDKSLRLAGLCQVLGEKQTVSSAVDLTVGVEEALRSGIEADAIVKRLIQTVKEIDQVKKK